MFREFQSRQKVSHLTVAQRAHDDCVIVVTDLLTNRIILHPLEAVDEADDAGDRSEDQHVGVKAKPCEVDSDLNAKVVFNVVEWLALPEFLKIDL